MLHVVMQILHAGFFRAAREHANAVLQGNLVIPEEFHQIQAQDYRGFVVRNAAADEEISRLGWHRREDRPTGRLRAPRPDGPRCRWRYWRHPKMAEAHVALVIRGVKAHFLCVGQGEIQHLAAFAGPKGAFSSALAAWLTERIRAKA